MADVLARAKGTTVTYVVGSGVAESSAGKMRILHYGEYPDEKDYDPRKDDNLPLWEASIASSANWRSAIAGPRRPCSRRCRP